MQRVNQYKKINILVLIFLLISSFVYTGGYISKPISFNPDEYKAVSTISAHLPSKYIMVHVQYIDNEYKIYLSRLQENSTEIVTTYKCGVKGLKFNTDGRLIVTLIDDTQEMYVF